MPSPLHPRPEPRPRAATSSHPGRRLSGLPLPIVGFLLFVLALAVIAGPAPARAGDRISILPEKIELTGPTFRQGLLVEDVENGQFIREITKDANLTSSAPA